MHDLHLPQARALPAATAAAVGPISECVEWYSALVPPHDGEIDARTSGLVFIINQMQ